jgi:hypothetical protein
MRYEHWSPWLLIATLTTVNLGSVYAADQAWKRIFNAKTLTWKAPDMSYFSVEDGAITDRQPASTILLKTSLLSGKAAPLTISS